MLAILICLFGNYSGLLALQSGGAQENAAFNTIFNGVGVRQFVINYLRRKKRLLLAIEYLQTAEQFPNAAQYAVWISFVLLITKIEGKLIACPNFRIGFLFGDLIMFTIILTPNSRVYFDSD